MKKIILILERDNRSVLYYKPIIRSFKKRKIELLPVYFNWKNKTPKEWVLEIKKQIEKIDSKVIMGFSISAFAAFLLATEYRVDKLFLCSMSPLFKEVKFPIYVKKILGKKRMGEIGKYSIGTMAKKISAETFFFVGENEQPEIFSYSKKISDLIKPSTFIAIKNVGHDINEEAYKAKIIKVILSKI